MDAKLRNLLRQAQSTGTHADYYAYLQALHRAGEFSLASYTPGTDEYIDTEARLQLCAQRYLADNTDLFVNFLRFQFGDLSTLFSLAGRSIIFERLEGPQGTTHQQIAPFISMGFDLWNPPDMHASISGLFPILDGMGTFVGSEDECNQFENAVGNFFGQFGEEAPDQQRVPCLTLPEIENIFSIANCLAPTLSRSHDLNWRGRALGDLQSSITYGITDRVQGDFRYRRFRLVKLGVFIPRWHRDTYFTADDIIEPGRPSAFIFEVRNDSNEPYWGVYHPVVLPDVAYDPFIVANHTPVLPGEIPGGDINWSPVMLLNAPEMPADISRDIQHALGNVELPTDGAILWLPANLPRTLPTALSLDSTPQCAACQRLQPYNRLCRKHAPRG